MNLLVYDIFRIFVSMIITKDNINKFIEGSGIYCSDMGITHIEYIPDGITRLYCRYNELTELPKLPESLKGLYCDNNKLTELPKLPDGLISLDCVNNKLTELPILPESLDYLSCEHNNLPYEVTIDNLKEHNKLIKRKQILKLICT